MVVLETLFTLLQSAVRACASTSQGSSLVVYWGQVTPAKCLSALQSAVPIDSIISNVVLVCKHSFA
jgi:hypothetical protein